MTDRAAIDRDTALARAARHLGGAAEAVELARAELAEALAEGPSKAAQTPVEIPSIVATHTRRHRAGRPSKIDADPELRAFILTRIDTMTFIALADAVATTFPVNRRIRKSAIADWWHRHLSDAARTS